MTGGLLALVCSFPGRSCRLRDSAAHWTDASTLVWFALAAVLLTAFFVIERPVGAPAAPVARDRELQPRRCVHLVAHGRAGIFAMFLFLGIFLPDDLATPRCCAGEAILPAVQRRHHPRCRGGCEPTAQGRSSAVDDPEAIASGVRMLLLAGCGPIPVP